MTAASLRRRAWIAIGAGFALAAPAVAHQPVMDMAPRWEGGSGVQLRWESRRSDTLLDGSREVANPFGRERRVDTLWIEGVYTFRREVRATFKLPLVDQSRTSVVGGRRLRTSGRGVGDAIVALPLKKYWNLDGWTANLGLTPNLRIPTGSTSDAYPVGDGSFDPGLSVSFSAESPTWYLLADAFWWGHRAGRRGIEPGDEYGFDLNLGVHPYHDDVRNQGLFVMLDVEARQIGRGRDDLGFPTGGRRLTVGPILVLYRDNVMARAELKVPISESVYGEQVSRGLAFQLGIGIAF